jgi:FlaA1/EpsC-like NDP-sugar epimerase
LTSRQVTDDTRKVLRSLGGAGLLSSFPSSTMLRNRHVLLLDIVLIATAAFGAFALRFDWRFLNYRDEFAYFLALAIVLKPLVYYPFGMYSRYWRYISIRDVFAIGLAVTASSVALALAVGLGRATGWMPGFARPVLLIDWILSLVLAAGLRVSVRVISEAQGVGARPADESVKRVLVVGAGQAGTLVVQELRRNPQMGMVPIAFADDASEKWHQQIHGLPVVGPLSALAVHLKTFGATHAVIAMPTAPGSVVRGASEICRLAGVETRVVPGVFELLDGQVSHSRLRKVEIADLLRRPQRVERAITSEYLRDRCVLVTGAGGSIGGELCRQIAYSRPRRLVIVGHGENSIFELQARLLAAYPTLTLDAVIADVRDRERIDEVFRRYRPDAVFHAAAHKHVPLMEHNPVEAFTNNVVGTANVLGASEREGVQRFVLISTDKAVSPSTIMGASKRLAESLVVSAGGRTGRPFVVVRFGNVLGSRGSVVPTMQAQIARGGPVTVTHPDMTRFFMTIPEAVHLVLQAGGIGECGNLYVLNMGEPVRIVDLAHDLIRLSGADAQDIAVTFTGIRPGEKLSEELWEEGAEVEPTSNPEIFKVREPDLRPDIDVGLLVNDVLSAAASGDRTRLNLALSLVVPSFSAPTGTETSSRH